VLWSVRAARHFRAPTPRLTSLWLDMTPQWRHHGVMELTPYVDAVRRDLAAAGEAAGAEVREASQRLSYALEPSLRLVLLEALGTAAAEVTAQLDAAVVELHLRGRDPDLVVSGTGGPVATTARAAPVADSDEGTSRISFRLPESLKARIEDAAAADGLSVNSWLVRAVAQTLDSPAPAPTARASRHISGWMR
jgi:hypothetical protein